MSQETLVENVDTWCSSVVTSAVMQTAICCFHLLSEDSLVVSSGVIHSKTVWNTQSDLALFTLKGRLLSLKSSSILLRLVASHTVTLRMLSLGPSFANVVGWPVCSSQTSGRIQALPSSCCRLWGILRRSDELSNKLLTELMVWHGNSSKLPVEVVRIAHGQCEQVEEQLPPPFDSLPQHGIVLQDLVRCVNPPPCFWCSRQCREASKCCHRCHPLCPASLFAAGVL